MCLGFVDFYNGGVFMKKNDDFMKKQNIIFSILSIISSFLFDVIFEKAWKKSGRDVPKNGGVGSSFGEYIVFVLLRSFLCAVIVRYVLSHSQIDFDNDLVDYKANEKFVSDKDFMDVE